MVGEGKDGVQTTEMTGLDSLPKTGSGNADAGSTINRPRLETPTLNPYPTNGASSISGGAGRRAACEVKSANEAATGWRVKLWRRMMGTANRSASQMLDDYRSREEPYVALPGDGDAISAVYAELNSVTGSIHRTTADATYPAPYHLNTYSEIREPRTALAPPAALHSLHLRRLLSDGTYENAGYALERGLVLLEHNESGSGSASTPSSAYYSDLSNSDRSGSHVPHPWSRPRHHSGSQGSSHSLPHCCHGRLHQHHSDAVRARDLMPVALQVIPDNQQIPAHSADPSADDMSGSDAVCADYFSRGGHSASLNNSSKRPLPPLPSRQQQRPQRRYAYAVNSHAHLSRLSDLSLTSEASSALPQGVDSPLSCVPSEYV